MRRQQNSRVGRAKPFTKGALCRGRLAGHFFAVLLSIYRLYIMFTLRFGSTYKRIFLFCFKQFSHFQEIKKKLSLGGQIYGIKPAWPEGEFYFYLVVLSGQQASSPTNTFHACGMIE
jgi:hypothetical protein